VSYPCLERGYQRHYYEQLVLASLILLSLSLTSCAAGETKKPSLLSGSSLSDPACAQPKSASGKPTLAGLAYGPAHTGQNPTVGVFPSDEEIQADLPTLAALTHSIRIYSSTGPARVILQAAQATHVCVALGIWLSHDSVANTTEILAGEQLASSPAVHALIVGNEVLQRGDLSEKQLRAALEQVRAKLRRPIPLTTAEPPDQWLQHPDLAKVVDFVTVHIYPFWQGQSIETAVNFLDKEYQKIAKAFPGKRIVIGETGWPAAGPPQGAAVPSAENQAQYLKAFLSWTQTHHVQYFYFEAFDEGWKIHEAGVGTHWGLYQQDGQAKPALHDLLPAPALPTLKVRSYRDVYVGGLETGFSLGIDTSSHQRDWLTAKNGVLLLAYPAHQQWGVMSITVGPPAPLGQRSSLDLSRYQTLVVDLRAGTEGQCVSLGIKDRAQSDDGSEITAQRCLRAQWSTVVLPLNIFRNVDLAHVYVVFELVFRGLSSATVEVRNIHYSPT
jgi:exo-beta-1,3-glucanase (GH17 family)